MVQIPSTECQVDMTGQRFKRLSRRHQQVPSGTGIEPAAMAVGQVNAEFKPLISSRIVARWVESFEVEHVLQVSISVVRGGHAKLKNVQAEVEGSASR